VSKAGLRPTPARSGKPCFHLSEEIMWLISSQSFHPLITQKGMSIALIREGICINQALMALITPI
jgi:hypothetical protein